MQSNVYVRWGGAAQTSGVKYRMAINQRDTAMKRVDLNIARACTSLPNYNHALTAIGDIYSIKYPDRSAKIRMILPVVKTLSDHLEPIGTGFRIKWNIAR